MFMHKRNTIAGMEDMCFLSILCESNRRAFEGNALLVLIPEVSREEGASDELEAQQCPQEFEPAIKEHVGPK